MSVWKELRLGDIVVFQRGHDLPHTQMIDGKFPVAGSNGVIGKHNRYTTKGPGITIGRSGNIGNPFYYTTDFWAHNTTLYIKEYNGNEPKFIYYLLKTIDFSSFNAGSAVPTLNRNHIHEHLVKIPPLSEQKAIAEVLGSLDDKIELLHQQNTTLEALAETLFRQWFVEGAKEEWAAGNLLDAVQLIGGGTPKTETAEYWDGNIPWISGKDTTPNHKRFILDTEKKITSSGLTNSSTKMLPSFSTIISARGTVGNYAILGKPMAFSQSNYGITPKYDECYFFTYLLIANSVDALKSGAYGAVFDTITTDTFRAQEIYLPKQSDVMQFEESVAPYFTKMLSNSEQICSLTKLRDELLPKLMSGEVRVSKE